MCCTPEAPVSPPGGQRVENEATCTPLHSAMSTGRSVHVLGVTPKLPLSAYQKRNGQVVAESGEDFIGTKCHLTQLCNGQVVPESGEDFIGVKCHRIRRRREEYSLRRAWSKSLSFLFYSCRCPKFTLIWRYLAIVTVRPLHH